MLRLYREYMLPHTKVYGIKKGTAAYGTANLFNSLLELAEEISGGCAYHSSYHKIIIQSEHSKCENPYGDSNQYRYQG